MPQLLEALDAKDDATYQNFFLGRPASDLARLPVQVTLVQAARNDRDSSAASGPFEVSRLGGG